MMTEQEKTNLIQNCEFTTHSIAAEVGISITELREWVKGKLELPQEKEQQIVYITQHNQHVPAEEVEKLVKSCRSTITKLSVRLGINVSHLATIRKSGTSQTYYNEIKKAVECLNSMCKKRKKTTSSKQNMQEICRIAKLAEEHGMSYGNFVIKYGDCINEE